jgi:hypothetical protein
MQVLQRLPHIGQERRISMTVFTFANVHNGRISADRSDLIDAPMWFHKQGLQETATGYGKRLNTGLKIHFEGRNRRLYCTCFSNSGTVWFKVRGQQIIVS